MNNSNEKKPVQLLKVSEDMVDRRLDNFLIGELKSLPRSRIYRMIRSGEVRVNKGRAKPSYRLSEGDQIRVPPYIDTSEKGQKGLFASQRDLIINQIVYEDDYLILFNKPSGMAVHGGSGINLGVIEMLRIARPENRFLELAHRLDRETSGCLLIVKKRSALRKLHEQFRDGTVHKSYIALLHGRWEHGDKTINSPLKVTHRKNGERFVIVSDSSGSKSALTHFFLQQNFSDYCLMNIVIETGRTHQIRVHAAEINYPIVSDERYAPNLKSPVGLRRLFLHAAELKIQHPEKEKHFDFSIPLSRELKSVLKQLKQQDTSSFKTPRKPD